MTNCVVCNLEGGREYRQPYGWTMLYQGETGGASWKHKGAASTTQRVGVISEYLCDDCRRRKRVAEDRRTLHRLLIALAVSVPTFGVLQYLNDTGSLQRTWSFIVFIPFIGSLITITFSLFWLYSIAEKAIVRRFRATEKYSENDLEEFARKYIWSMHRKLLEKQHGAPGWTTGWAEGHHIEPKDIQLNTKFENSDGSLRYKFDEFERATSTKTFGPLDN